MGNHLDELPMIYGSDAPFIVFSIPDEEREERVQLTDDVCIVDDQYFYIRGNIYIRVAGTLDVFSWNVWVSLTQDNFDFVVSHWDDPEREHKLQPMFGWLATSIPLYPETLGLKLKIHTQSIGLRPSIELEPTSHLLSVEQQEGITMERIHQFAKKLIST